MCAFRSYECTIDPCFGIYQCTTLNPKTLGVEEILGIKMHAEAKEKELMVK